jgi:hypothetical protein
LVCGKYYHSRAVIMDASASQVPYLAIVVVIMYKNRIMH